MTNITDDELNEAIFKAKGWEKMPPPSDPGWWEITIEGVTHFLRYVPDYTHDWRLCGELLEEMSAGGGEPSLRSDDTFGWACNVQIQKVNSEGIGVFAPTPQRAICEAWLAWKEQG